MPKLKPLSIIILDEDSRAESTAATHYTDKFQYIHLLAFVFIIELLLQF
ncbi:hypothetical protein [Paenibacillus taichungensis]|nr:hypothetical protein [Paenibacillus taichungensis]